MFWYLVSSQSLCCGHSYIYKRHTYVFSYRKLARIVGKHERRITSYRDGIMSFSAIPSCIFIKYWFVPLPSILVSFGTSRQNQKKYVNCELKKRTNCMAFSNLKKSSIFVKSRSSILYRAEEWARCICDVRAHVYCNIHISVLIMFKQWVKRKRMRYRISRTRDQAIVINCQKENMMNK